MSGILASYPKWLNLYFHNGICFLFLTTTFASIYRFNYVLVMGNVGVECLLGVLILVWIGI